MSMQTLAWDVDAAAVAGNSDAYSLALATQARQKRISLKADSCSSMIREFLICQWHSKIGNGSYIMKADVW